MFLICTNVLRFDECGSWEDFLEHGLRPLPDGSLETLASGMLGL